jgi:hypothetical protein
MTSIGYPHKVVNITRQLNRPGTLLPLSYVLVFLLPLLIVSTLWFFNLTRIEELNGESLKRSFISAHEQMVENEVKLIVDGIDGVGLRTLEDYERGTG